MFSFFNDTATTEIYTLSLHDALPIYGRADRARPRHYPGTFAEGLPDHRAFHRRGQRGPARAQRRGDPRRRGRYLERSEEHTSELQSRQYLVCRLLLEKKNTILCYAYC